MSMHMYWPMMLLLLLLLLYAKSLYSPWAWICVCVCVPHPSFWILNGSSKRSLPLELPFSPNALRRFDKIVPWVQARVFFSCALACWFMSSCSRHSHFILMSMTFFFHLHPARKFLALSTLVELNIQILNWISIMQAWLEHIEYMTHSW